MTLGGCPIHWVSKLQTLIAQSTCESEYVTLTQALRDLIPLHRLFDAILHSFNLSEGDTFVKSTVFEDNNGAIAMASTTRMTPRTKHIATRYHFIKQDFWKRTSS